MKKVVNNINSIAVKLCLSYGLIIAIMIISVLIGIRFVIVTENRGNNLYDNYGVVQSDAAMALSYFNELKVDMRNLLYVYHEDTDKKEELYTQINGWQSNLVDYLAKVDAVELNDECEAYLQEAYANLENYLSDMEISISYIQKNQVETARTYFIENAVGSANKVKEPLVNMVDALKEYAASEKGSMHAQNIINYFIMGVILAIAVVLAFLIAIIMIKNIRVPVLKLTKEAKKMAEGDMDINIMQTTKDEMGIMMGSFAEMVENIKQQKEIVDNIADGNLCVQVNVRSEHDSMNQALKRMVADNNRILTDIYRSTGEISNGSSQLSAASQTLAQGATQQASAIEEISASVKDISGRAGQNAEQTRQAKDFVEGARSSAIIGNTEMQEMMTAMKGINESSENISKIIKVIDDIAFQTNILALNAAVEAQRAGVHGKGFAVVAEEVRNLAGKSAAASKETAELIEDSIKKVSHGSKLAENTAVALKGIVDNIDHVVDLIGGIAKASDIQASESAQIDQAISQVSLVVQTNSATSEECAASCEELSGQAEKLRKLLGHYKLVDNMKANK